MGIGKEFCFKKEKKRLKKPHGRKKIRSELKLQNYRQCKKGSYNEKAGAANIITILLY